MIGVQLSSELMIQWGSYFYSPPSDAGRVVYVSIALVGVMFIAGRVFDIAVDPLIGVWSDNTRPRPSWRRIVPVSGRRRPFIFWGAILMTASGIAFWYPPDAAETRVNFWYGTILMCVHWGFYTLCYVPLHALAPEVASAEQDRVRLGRWIAVGMTFGVIVANVLPGVLVTALDPALASADGAAPAVASPVGFQRVAIIFSVATLACFLFTVFAVRERYTAEAPGSKLHEAVREMTDAMRNRVFLLFFTITVLFNIGYLAGQRVIPYWAVIGLGGNEATVTALLLPFVVTCLLTAAVMPMVSRRLSLKTMLIISVLIIGVGLPLLYPIGEMNASTETKVLAGQALMGLVGVAQGMLYVLLTPILGEIIDDDARRSGRRREAVYNGIYAISWKAGAILSVFLSTQTMSLLGNSKESPLGVFIVGPLGGAFAFAAFALALFYPKNLAAQSRQPIETPDQMREAGS